MDDMREVFEFDQQRAQARRYVQSLAGDVIAYRAALQDAGISDPLLGTLVAQFNTSWLGNNESEVVFDLSMLTGEDE
jgi:hypothetical protein